MEKYNLPVEYKNLKSYEKRLVREQYIKEQGGKCYYCGELLSGEPSEKVKRLGKEINWKLFPKGFLDYPHHLHHSHNNGLTIGTVHSLCNAVLWQFEGE